MYIDTSTLIPTHNRLRNPELVSRLLGDLNSLDKAIDSKEDLINVGEIEGSLYIFNSHHRIVAVNIAYGRIKESNLNIKRYTLEEMLSVNLDIGWVTPFDPHFFCRVPDIKDFAQIKKYLIKGFKEGFSTIESIEQSSKKFIEPRVVQTLGELYNV
jgi:hypothetical protein